MPQYFQLIDKVTGKPESFPEVDRKLCEHLGVPCDPVKWYRYWYPILMEWGIAMGATWAKLRSAQPEMVEIIDWLDEHYVANAWARIGK